MSPYFNLVTTFSRESWKNQEYFAHANVCIKRFVSRKQVVPKRKLMTLF